METLETRLRVRYAETDQMGVVYYANYLIWMEVGRAELCRARRPCCGLDHEPLKIFLPPLALPLDEEPRPRAVGRLEEMKQTEMTDHQSPITDD